jgi:hypothetical protein
VRGAPGSATNADCGLRRKAGSEKAHARLPLRMEAAARSVDDLPEGILAADLPVDELEQVASAHLNGLACPLRPAKRPLRDAAVTADPVGVVAVVDVRNPVEPGLDPFPNLRLPTSRRPPGPGPRGMSRTQSSVRRT